MGDVIATIGSASPVFHASISAGRPGALVEHAVFGLDRWLRQRQGVYEFSDDPLCLFRVQRTAAERDIVLSDGTVHAGDAVLDLHLWNEHIPPLGACGFSMTWAREATRRVELSMYGLARHLKWTRALDDIVVLRGDMRLGTAQRDSQLARIAAHYGFEPAEPDAGGGAALGLKHFAENLFICLLVLATNPVSLRSAGLRRCQRLVYLSRAALEKRYAAAVMVGCNRVGGAERC